MELTNIGTGDNEAVLYFRRGMTLILVYYHILTPSHPLIRAPQLLATQLLLAPARIEVLINFLRSSMANLACHWCSCCRLLGQGVEPGRVVEGQVVKGQVLVVWKMNFSLLCNVKANLACH